MRILIVEDEFKLADLIATRLEAEKYLVDIAEDGEDGLYNATINTYDLIILDIMLPKLDGLKVLETLRAKKIITPVILLTAKSTITDKLKGFATGADDYLTKPFHMEELVARVNTKLRQTAAKSSNLLTFGDLELNPKKSLLTCTTTGQTVEIVCKELFILECLIKNAGSIVSKQLLHDNVWGMDGDFVSNSLEAYLSFIRKKLGAIGSTVTIKAVRGLGYRLEAPANLNSETSK